MTERVDSFVTRLFDWACLTFEEEEKLAELRVGASQELHCCCLLLLLLLFVLLSFVVVAVAVVCCCRCYAASDVTEDNRRCSC